MTSDVVHFGPTWEAPDRFWRDHAACRGCDPDLFHPRRGQDITAAKAVCATCPVVDTCLEWALENNETMGVWGGRSERERRAMRRQLRIERAVPAGQPLDWLTHQRHGTETGYQWHQRHKDLGPACDACRIAHAEHSRVKVAEWRARQRGDAA